MQYAFHTLTIICILVTFVSSMQLSKWWVKIWDINRVNVACIMFTLVIIGIIFLPLTEWWSIVYITILSFSIIYHVSIFYPFFSLHPVELHTTQNRTHAIKVLAYNVRKKNKKYDQFLSLIEKVNPDLCLLTEVDQGWINATNSLNQQYPYSLQHPQENTYGIALFSKLPLINPRLNFLVDKEVPSIHSIIQFKDKQIQFLGLHPRPPAPSNIAEEKDLELIKIAGMTNYNLLPTIVGGDLNDVGWSKITQKFKLISGLLDPRIGRGFYNTYNALIPLFRIPIDHFFVSKHFKLLRINRLEKIGSDHFPVLLEVNLEDD